MTTYKKYITINDQNHNGVLKQEIIYPEKPCDRTLLIFTLLIIPIFRILSFFIIIFIPKKS